MWYLMAGIVVTYTLGLIIFCVRKIKTIEEPITDEDRVEIPKYVGIDTLREEVKKNVGKLR